MKKKQIEKNYLAAILGMNLTEWVLTLFTCGLYLILPLLRVYLQNVEYDDKRVYINKGIVSKTHEVLELYKLQNIDAKSNVFGYGSMRFIEKNKIIVVNYVKNPQNAIIEMIELKDNAQSNKGVSTHEVF